MDKVLLFAVLVGCLLMFVSAETDTGKTKPF